MRGFAITEVSTFFTMPKRKTMRRKQRGGGLKEDALAALKKHGVDTSRSGLETFLFDSGHFPKSGDTYEIGNYIFMRAKNRTVDLTVYRKGQSYKDSETLASYE